MNLKNIFKKRKDKYASPYYGGSGPLVNAPAFPPKREETETVARTTAEVPVHFIPKARPTDPDWEQRRFELMKTFVCQERKSVVLGKLKANDKQIVAKARSLADASIRELQTNPYKSYEATDQGGEADA